MAEQKAEGKKAQAALEFLMTYGWAILIMLVVIAVLFYLGVFSSSSSVPSSCVLPAGFTCKEFSLDSSGRLYLDLGQATGKTITVTGVGCGPSGSSVSNLSLPVTVQTGSNAVVSDSDVTCSGNYSGAFKGKVSIRYQPAGATYNKTITGDFSAPVAVVAAGERGQWNTSYGFYRQVTVNTGVSSNLTDFPAYFILDTQHLIAWGRMNSSCKDLRVVNSTKDGVMDYEIENNTCNTTNTVVWFRIPQTNAASGYTAYVFYGNSSAADAQNKAGVWQNGFVAVYHLGDLQDSSGGTALTNTSASYTPNGARGGAMEFNGATSRLNATGALPVNALSYEVFVNASTIISFDHPIGIGDGHKATAYLYGGSNTSAVKMGLDPFGNCDRGCAAYSSGSWMSISASFNGTRVAGYKNGAICTSTSVALSTMNFTGNSIRIGTDGDGGNYFNGTIDEVRISNVARSADWFLAEYGQTYSVGSEQVN